MNAEQHSAAPDPYETILRTYERLGFPREIITHWTLPKADVDGLLRQFDATRPLNILEVGTFVGMSTMLISAHCHPASRIHTVDPNFPLAVELSAMKTPLEGCDQTMRQQVLAHLAAQELGLADRISFHAGGFAAGATFVSARASCEQTVPVIGPDLCAAHGPFDVIFLDGLHYESTVHADVVLAAEHLAAGGRIVLHDVIGRWGSNVRRAAWRFIDQNPEFRFRHGRYSSIYDAIGVIRRVDDDEPPAAGVVSVSHPGLQNPEYRRHLATVIGNQLAPTRVALIGGDPFDLGAALHGAGVSSVERVAPGAAAVSGWDLAILSDIACEGAPDTFEAALDVAVRAADAVLVITTPPGEDVAGPYAKPMAWWAREFLARGYVLHDVIRPDFEPMRFAYSTNTLYQVDCSRDCSVYLARRLPAADDTSVLRELVIEKERRIEDLVVQGVYTDFLLRDTVQKWISAAEHYQRALAEIERLKGAGAGPVGAGRRAPSCALLLMHARVSFAARERRPCAV